MTILLSLGDDIKINMFLNKGFLNTMVIGETWVYFKYYFSTKITVVFMLKVIFSSVAVLLTEQFSHTNFRNFDFSFPSLWKFFHS